MLTLPCLREYQTTLSLKGHHAARIFKPDWYYIKKEVKDIVYKRANGKCERCNSTYALEIDHLKSFATGGESSSNNLQLLCRSCNARKAIEEFGQIKMDLFLLKTG